MAIVNNNKVLIDRPMWEQLSYAPVVSAAGTIIEGDGSRFIYIIYSATSFWRYDTWADCWQQLASPPSGTLGAGSTMRHTLCVGTQTAAGEIYGSIYLFTSNGVAAPAFAIYDVSTNVWTALSVTTIPATFGTDSYLQYPDVESNGWLGTYHSAVITAVTASALANAGATSITVTALPFALPAKAILNFGTLASPKFAVLTAAAAAAATTITVAALLIAVPASAVAYYYDHMYLVGNAATQMYRYTLSTNTWSTTTANVGNAVLPALPIAPAAGGTSLRRFTSVDAGKLTYIRGASSSQFAYQYDLVANTWGVNLAIVPATETLGLGSCTTVRTNSSGLGTKVLIQKDATMRIYELDIAKLTIKPIAYQYLITTGAALVGEKAYIMKSVDGIEFYYILLHTSQYFVRTPLFF
jgi:hypothetical protein